MPGTFVNKTNLQLTLEWERNISRAAKHVDMITKQRAYFNAKKAEAYADRDKCKSDRCYCYVADYAQNACVPTFNSEQPCETFFYSPANCYIFGVADASHKPTKLTAHVYMEFDGKKGGNNVASLLWKQFKLDGLVPQVDPTTQDIIDEDHVPAKEINLVFDNCGGQNKNRMVLRMLTILVKRKVCMVARAIFLIRGHTKNDCDRLFNLMKQNCRGSNIYTPQDL